MAVDKKWAICIVFTSLIVVAAIVVPVVVMSRGSGAEGAEGGINDPFLEAQQPGHGTGEVQMFAAQPAAGDEMMMVAPEARGGGGGTPNGGAMAPSQMVVQFGGMIECVSDRGSIAYNGYGCYCGLGGSGKPVDNTDRCCRQHDQCYSRIKRQGLCKGDKSVYLTWYKVKMSQCNTPNAKITCDHHVRYSFFDSLLAGRQPRCASALCNCDRVTALCFAQHSHTYNFGYAAYQGKNMC